MAAIGPFGKFELAGSYDAVVAIRGEYDTTTDVHFSAQR
jgi:hypothetical protein